MTNEQANRLHQIMLQLADVVREVDDNQLTYIFDQLVDYMVDHIVNDDNHDA